MLKRVKGLAIAGAMAVSVAAAPIASFAWDDMPSYNKNAQSGYDFGAQQLITGTDFSQGIGTPWHMNFTRPADAAFRIFKAGEPIDMGGLSFTGAQNPDGAFVMTIVNRGGKSVGGESRWDLQIRHRELPIRTGAQYTIGWKMAADKPGGFNVKVGDTTGDNEYWNSIGGGDWASKVTFPQTAPGMWTAMDGTNPQCQNMTWTPRTGTQALQQTVDIAGEWAFHLGGDGEWSDPPWFENETTLAFSGLYLKAESGAQPEDYWVRPDPYVRNGIVVNQVGYLTNAKKLATVILDGDEPGLDTADILDASGAVVGEATATGPAFFDEDSGENVRVLDFSSFATPGKGYTLKAGAKVSYPFTVGSSEEVYGVNDASGVNNAGGSEARNGAFVSKGKANNALLEDSFNYYYLNRAAVDLDPQYVVASTDTQLARKGTVTAGYPTPEFLFGNLMNDSGKVVPFFNGGGTQEENNFNNFGTCIFNGKTYNSGVNTGEGNVPVEKG
ncbi:MAG: hypothetical protein LBR54_03350, partial [Oscillospiraceae bacterium]|nr:hypothetical protein [Oscillospiraceae bacterium]